MAPKQYRRPQNPPRLPTEGGSRIPPMPSTPPPRPTSVGSLDIGPMGEQLSPAAPELHQPGRRSPSPSVSSGHSTPSSAGNRTSRKPVPVYNPTDEPPLPESRPHPTNPNPFAAANALVAMREREARDDKDGKAPPSRPANRPPPLRPSTAPSRVEAEENSPTSKPGRSTSPVSHPPSGPDEHDEDDGDMATLNFARRPSSFDPLAPSFHPSHAAGGPSRSLLAAAPITPTRSSHSRQRSAHARQQSISLPSPSTSPLPSPSFAPSSGSGPFSTQPPTESRKILPLQPAAQKLGNVVPPTRAPIEAFASVEMLQGQQQASERARGLEVFGPRGYEGRSSSISGEGGLPAYARRPSPLENLHAARNPLAAASHSTHGGVGAPQLPPLQSLGGAGAEADVFSIASQLREHDKERLRRGSEDVHGGNWPRRFSSTSSGEDESPSESGSNQHTLNPHFSFPFRSNHSSISLHTVSSAGGAGGKTSAPAYNDGLQSGWDDDDDSPSSNKHRYPPDLKSFFTFGHGAGGKRQDETAKGGWRTEHLGTSQLASSLQPRPSIVALPVYPSPGGSVSRSTRTRAKKIVTKVCILTGMAAVAATWFYLYVRYGALRDVDRKRPGIFVGGWAFLTLEAVVAFMTSIHILWTTLTYRPRSTEPKMRLRGDANLPSVDVFIVSSGQADQTVFDCAVAAASMDYPPHRYRVMVLDPLGSTNLQNMLSRHAKSQACPHLSYHRRELGSREEKKHQVTKGGKDEADHIGKTKANSINFGMMEASSFGIKGPAEYIAVFDADMIPERNYLRAVLPHIITSPETALVKTRHGFINLPHRLSQPASTLYTASETPSDTRSGFLLRRAALTEIGGFPADSWIHDGQCEALLLGRGYAVQQVEEVLQWGMAKPTYAAQINAMMVNRLGPLRTAHRLGWFMFGKDKTKLMPFKARAKAIGRALLPIFSLIVILLAYVYPFMFSFGGILVLTPNLANLNHLLQSTLLMLLLTKLHESLWCWSTGLPSPRRALQTWIFAAPYQGFALVRLFLPTKLGGFKRGSDLDINEVIANPVREVWWKRAFWFALDPHAGTMFAFLGALGVAIWRIVKDYERGTVDEHQTALTVLLTVAWPTLLWLEFVFAAFVPFVTMLFPSRLLTEPRESFLIRDHYSSVARPKHHFKTASPLKVNRAPEFVSGTVVIAWAVVCVCVAKLTDVLA
ncbi:hypothetical protein JCM11641_006526 [Rhodosporidiobolus odoratus]